jgi:hypothetical protein
MAKVIKTYFLSEGVNELPYGKVLLIAHKDKKSFPYIWIEHDIEDERTVSYKVIGKKKEDSDDVNYPYHVGSCVCGFYVWHVYANGIFNEGFI